MKYIKHFVFWVCMRRFDRPSIFNEEKSTILNASQLSSLLKHLEYIVVWRCMRRFDRSPIFTKRENRRHWKNIYIESILKHFEYIVVWHSMWRLDRSSIFPKRENQRHRKIRYRICFWNICNILWFRVSVSIWNIL